MWCGRPCRAAFEEFKTRRRLKVWEAADTQMKGPAAKAQHISDHVNKTENRIEDSSWSFYIVYTSHIFTKTNIQTSFTKSTLFCTHLYPQCSAHEHVYAMNMFMPSPHELSQAAIFWIYFKIYSLCLGKPRSWWLPDGQWQTSDTT